MAQVTNETAYGEINVGDVMPDGNVVVDKIVRETQHGETVRLQITYGNGLRATWFGEMFADKLYGEAVAEANARHTNLAFGD